MDASLNEDDPKNWGTRIEVKNVNSFGGVRDAINYEIERQTQLKETGEYDKMEQQTRRWDEENCSTIYMRSKVDAIDYKYFVEPNIPKYKLSKKWLDEIRASIPELAHEKRLRYINECGLSEYDANVLTKEKEVADYFDECLKLGIDAKTAANWVTVQILGYANKNEITINDLYMTPQRLKFIIDLLQKGTISSKQAKEVFFKVLENEKEPSEFIDEDSAQISDENELEKIIDEILDNNSSQVEAYKNGKTNLFDFFVGQVMKNTRGKANPIITKELLNKKLN